MKEVYNFLKECITYYLTTYPELKSMYTPRDGNSQVFYLKDATATFCSFSASYDETKIIKF